MADFPNYYGYPLPPGGSSSAAGSTFTFLTCTNETAGLPNSLELIPGAGVSFSYGANTLTINATSASGGLGTVTSVGLGAPNIFSISGSPVTSSGTLTLTLVNQACSTVFAGPSAGASAPPTFRYLIGTDIVNAISAGSNVTLVPVGNTIQINSSNPGGTVTSVAAGNITGIVTTVVNSPTTTPGIVFTLVNQTSGTALMGPVSGAATAPTFRAIQGQDLLGTLVAGSNMTVTLVGNTLSFASTNPGGTVTSVSDSGLPGYINANVSSPTTTPAISLSWVNVPSAGLFLGGPSAGASTTPWFRQIQALDISQIFLPGTNISLVETPTSITINSSNSGGTVTSVALALPVDTYSISGSPVTVSGTLTGSFVNQVCGTFHAGPSAGASAPPTWRIVTGNDLAPAIVSGTNSTVVNNGATIQVNVPNALGGTVTSVAQTVPASIMSVSGSPITTSGTLGITLVTQPCSFAWMGPVSGANATPTFRLITLTDLPSTIQTTALTNGHVWIGNASNIATDTSVTGDVTISNSGVTTIANNAVTNAKFRQSAAISVVGNSTNATANVGDITATGGSQVLASNAAGTALSFRSLVSGDLPSTVLEGFTAGNLSTWFNTTASVTNSIANLAFNPTGAKGDIPYFSNTNTPASLAVGLTSQLIGVNAGLPGYVNTLQGFASAVTTAVLTNASPSYQYMDASAGAVTLTLPAASAAPSDIFYFKNGTVTGTNACTVQTNGTDFIDGGVLSKTIVKLQVLAVISDGVQNWRYLKPQLESPQSGGTGSQTVPTDGQVPIGATSTGTYFPANLTAGTNVSIVNGPSSITISAVISGAGFAWATLSGTASAAINTKYEVNVSGGGFNVYMPSTTPAAGTLIAFKVVNVGSPANTLTIVPYTTIDGSGASITSARLNEYLQFEYGATGWWETS